MIEEILDLVKKHDEWRGRRCLNLIPSENVMSPAVRSLLSSEFAHRYTARDHFYMGTRFTDDVERLGEEIARDVFKAETADLRPLSGHTADLIIFANFAKPGDAFMCVSAEDGGYPGMWKDGLAALFNLEPIPFPFSRHDWNVKTEEAEDAIRRLKPRMVIFGASLMVFPHPVKELAQIAQENGAFVGFDSSHVLGLIAGKQFQDPLREGACAMFGSTHKSFFGPQGGIVLADEEHGQIIREKIYPAFVDNAHWNRIAALTLALAEMQKFGEAYAKQVILNSETLARALHDYGFPVICEHLGFTQSHQTILDYGNYDQGRKVAEKLQRANIIVDCVVRLGTCEVTRHGMKEADMSEIAELIKRVVIDEDKPEEIQKGVAKLAAEFREVEYCFKE